MIEFSQRFGVWSEAKVGDVVRDDSTGRWVVAKRNTHKNHVDFILLDQYTGNTMSCRTNTTLEEELQDNK